MTARRPRRHPLVTLAVLGAGIAAGRAIARQHRVVAPVPRELRTPMLYLPASVRDERSLRIGRALLAKVPSPMAEGASVERRRVQAPDGHGVDVLVYEPATRSRPSGALVWIHGGGLVMGRVEGGHATCSRLAVELGIVVVSVDYRLAPEHPFPAGLDDCVAALRWLHADAEALGVDQGRIAVGGDSAGGGLAAAVCQRVRDEGGAPVALQLLVYPMLDDRTVLRADLAPSLVWTQASNRFGWTAYLGHGPGPVEDRPYAVPARTEDLAGLPSTWIGVGDVDLFHDEDVAYAERLRDAGVACELEVVPGMYHGADAVVTEAPAVRAFRSSMTEALRRAVTA